MWLAVSNDETKVSGRLFYHQKEIRSKAEADDVLLQEGFLNTCKEVTNVSLPEGE